MFLQNLYSFLYFETDMPPSYSTFHLISLAVVLLCTVLAVWKLAGVSEKAFRRFALIIWCALVVGEIYRQICFSLNLTDGSFVWDYAWYQFPFQLCSAPLYMLPFVIFLKDGKVRDGFLCFLSLWSFFGGAAVMIYPGDVLCPYIGINVQSMIHHGAQMLIGAVIAARNGRRMNLRYFLSGLYVYLGYLAVAMLLNIVGYRLLTANGMDDVFNMMFISPYFPCTLPILSSIHAATSWGVLFPLYVLGFLIIALIIFLAERLLVTMPWRRKAQGDPD